MQGYEPRTTLGTRLGMFLRRRIPERQIILRTDGRVTYFRISRSVQIGFFAFLMLAGTWSVFTSVGFVLHEDVLAVKDAQTASARLAYRSLLTEVAQYRNKFAAVTGDLKESHGLMASLVEFNASLQEGLDTVERELATTRSDREQVIAARERLKAQLQRLEGEMHSLVGHNFDLGENLEAVQSGLQRALGERNQAIGDASKARRQIKTLEVRLVELEESEEEAIQRLSARAGAFIVSMERVVGLTGLKVEALLAAVDDRPAGQGGPFIEAKADGLPAANLKAGLANLDSLLDRWESLTKLMQRLPLAAPLDTYYVTSRFGKRRDPINNRWAAHYGVDLGSAFRSSVFNTAPGVVTYVGWKGRYGKLVEVEHGAGLKTRYGHLHKIHVKKGQELKFRDRIGRLGNTGRSTGAHLHYEVVFGKKTVNPIKFIKAGRYVFQE